MDYDEKFTVAGKGHAIVNFFQTGNRDLKWLIASSKWSIATSKWRSRVQSGESNLDFVHCRSLANNSIRFLTQHSFRGLRNLRELYVSLHLYVAF